LTKSLSETILGFSCSIQYYNKPESPVFFHKQYLFRFFSHKGKNDEVEIRKRKYEKLEELLHNSFKAPEDHQDEISQPHFQIKAMW
jgi:hypothetical protein